MSIIFVEQMIPDVQTLKSDAGGKRKRTVASQESSQKANPERRDIPRKMMKDVKRFPRSAQVGSDGKRRVGRSKIGN